MTIAAEVLDLASLAVLCGAPVWLACWCVYVVEQSQRSILTPDARAAYALAAGAGQLAVLARELHARGWVREQVPCRTTSTGYVLAWRPGHGLDQ